MNLNIKDLEGNNETSSNSAESNSSTDISESNESEEDEQIISNNEEKQNVTSKHNRHLEEAELARKQMNSDLKIAAVTENKKNPIKVEVMQKEDFVSTSSIEKDITNRKKTTNDSKITSNNEEKQNVTSEHNRHLEEAELARKQMNSDLKIAAVTENSSQNRNIKIVLLLKSILKEKPTLEKIRLRFLVSGHNFLPNDSDFGDVESALKIQQKLKNTSRLWKTVEKNPIKVEVMQKEDFVSTSSIEKDITNRKKTTNDSKLLDELGYPTVGTLRKSRRSVPKFSEKLNRGDSQFRVNKEGAIVFRWQDTKDVLATSNCFSHTTPEVKCTMEDGTKNDVAFPAMLQFYNASITLDRSDC
ncbi:hypothetical protein ILUMI_07606 [Ignelater luminosus]|uniref:PiggyBac transposable element-derived protein domain-containing protein n=1 Tax=Ignelater luminosus TaxID=2038154 RepID=A0A8K0D3J7_IGNLU|nr:hypothetical protein ILUMI_07606 [Ignelater luminosus]